ncbi:DEAD/DEAH box helicase [Rubrobacter taiwanensis]|nr:DEAD/DEAH box helicase [Rubrobacter taiwanensis]
MEFVVTNEPPKGQKCEELPGRLIEIFRAGARSQSAEPFWHQAQAFSRLLDDQELVLVAGTASGKTLAVGTPLFYKLQRGEIHKVLLMYPTLALLEDQRRVLQLLAETTDLTEEIGQLRGGMSRSALIHNLNKRVLLATPDAVYWFFRKNVKYNALLVYGLCQVDEFVLDEAHLFNGLMLRNVEHLWQRLKLLAGCLNKTPRLHILTATPTTGLRELSGAEDIPGKSKCNSVSVEIRPSGRFDRRDQFTKAINEMLDSGQRKVLVVCNSARMAHQLFEKYRVADISAIALEHRLKFGKVKLDDLMRCLTEAGVQKESTDELSVRLSGEGDVVLADIPDGTELNLPLQEIVAQATEALENQGWLVKRALRDRAQYPGETWEALLKNRPLPCRIVAAVRQRLEAAVNLDEQQATVDEWLASVLERLSTISDDQICCKARDFDSLTKTFVTAGLDKRAASLLTKRLTFEMKADPAQLPKQSLSHRPVYLRWLDWAVKDDEKEKVREAVKSDLASGELNAELRHIGLWSNTDVPVIVYSGSMAKGAREGLIDAFSDMERAVLISTSAVEVGVDFHADALITEECEGNSFLQRFGRVGRHDKSSKVVALVSGDAYAALSELDEANISRERFSEKITDVFPRYNYASASQMLDAGHYLINEQLGRIGGRLNGVPELQEAKPMAERFRTAGIQLNFGLRNTMPQITLRDGVGRDPFYLLRYVDDDKLRPADSPFEVARATTWFTGLIFQGARFDVIVDLEQTLKASQHVFLSSKDGFDIWSRPGAGLAYLQRMNDHFGRTGGWSKWHPGNLMLLNGDVYLSRIDRDHEMPVPEAVFDSEQNPLFIPNQTYLVLWGWTDAEETRELLKDIVDWEELYYDWDRLQFEWAKAMVILENTAGACFAAYRELVEYVGRQVQR